ncbi:sialoadhesin-like [Pungitius pungitius]|uniref:sialoadhesin-like n=1 Tax=Pungitius pungitius TaxID=134920 RepID=UPI002E13E57E
MAHPSERPKVQLSKDSPVEGSVTLTCSVGSSSSSGWKFFWYRDEKTSEPLNLQSGSISPSGGGVYWCRGGRGDPVYYTEYSHPVGLRLTQKLFTNRAVVKPNWPEIFSGETITLTCGIKEGAGFEWEYEWRTPDYYTPQYRRGSMMTSSVRGDYSCKGRLKDEASTTEWSDAFTLVKTSAAKPKAQLSKDSPVEGSVTLTCSVDSSSSSSGWKFFWYKDKKTSEHLNLQSGSISPSGGGVYWCRGGRGDPVYYTEYSHPVVTNRAVVKPNWPEIFSGETITLTCGIKEGGGFEWEHEWKTPDYYTPQNPRGSTITSSVRGDYECKGRLKNEASTTEWSDAFTLTTSDVPQPVLTVSPSWTSPGDSVTLTCSVGPPSAGWRFFWVKAVHKLSLYNYTYELLAGSTTGTEQGSYVLHGQTHTAGYVCRAGRGDPVIYTLYSDVKFVWSGGVNPAASLTVSPHRLQHFSTESLSLSCEGTSTEWRVMKADGSGFMSSCSYWGEMTGSTCNTNTRASSGVYWCESETQYSNAANITIHSGDVILVSSVRPVTEGHSVSLGCELRTKELLDDVDFYKDDKLLPNAVRGELFISAVTKSHKGFYKCRGRKSPQGLETLTSAESWLSVECEYE